MKASYSLAWALVASLVPSFLMADGVKYWSDVPVTCHWIGKVKRGNTSQSDYEAGNYPVPQSPYAQWTNHNNWADGIVPGRLQVVQEDGSIATNGCEGCTAVFDENCDIRCIELNGMVSVSNIVITGSAAPEFVFGHWLWDNPYLYMEAGGSFKVDPGVSAPQHVVPRISLHNATSGCELITIENNSTEPLRIGYIDLVRRPPSWYGALKITYRGTGEIHKRSKNQINNWCATMRLDMNGGCYVSKTTSHVEWGMATVDNYYYIRDVDNGFTQKIRIPEGKYLNVDENSAIITKSGMDISGDGILNVNKTGALPYFCAAEGKTLDISVDMNRIATAGEEFEGVQIGSDGYPGRVRLSGNNFFAGLVQVKSGATLEVPSFGYGDVNGPVGRKGVLLQNYSALRYTGDGETTDRSLAGSGYGSVILAGSGDLVWKGEISGGTTYHYTITNESATARFVCANKLVTKALALAPEARLGFAKPDDSGTIEVDMLKISGNVFIEVIDDVSVTIKNLVRLKETGVVAVDVSGGGKFTVQGLEEGCAENWLSINGKTAWISANGTVFALDEKPNDRTVAAHGDVIPDVPSDVVGIVSAGDESSGNTTLEKDVTNVLALNHETTEDATVGIAEGQVFKANLVRVKSGAGNLTLGDAAGKGSVGAESVVFETRVDDADSVLTVNSSLDVPKTVPVKVHGAGTTVFSAFNGYEGLLNLFDAKVVVSNSVNVSAAELSGTGTFDFDGGIMRLVASDENGVNAVCESDVPVSLAVTGGVLRLTGEKPLPVQEIRVPHGELVLDGVNLHSPGYSMDMTEVPQKTLIVGSNGTAVVRLNGGSVTGALELASYVSAVAKGAMYQSGGEFVNLTPYAESYAIGCKGFAYYNISGGRFVAAGDWYLGAYGEGVLDMTGGELYHTPSSVRKSRCRLGGWDGFAAVRVAGGAVFNATNIAEALIMPGYSRSESSSEMTVEDGGAVLTTSKGISLGMGTSETYSHSVLNMNGGVVSTYHVTRSRNYVYPSDEWPEGKSTSEAFANTYAFVNCNGGTLKNLGWSALFGSRTSDSYPPNRVTLYERGLTIDSNGMNCRLDPGGGLQAPEGLGVVSVKWDEETDGKGFVGSPRVKIVGDGLGATAWADFDVTTRTVKQIYVTAPGNNYTYANAQIVMNKKVVKTVPCTVGQTISGGLVKIGSADVKITATNTYTGATVIRKGSLTLGADDVFSCKSKLVLDGGNLDMNGKKQVFSSVEVTENGGNVVNGTLTLSGLTVDFNDVRAGKSLIYNGDIVFAAGAELTLLNASDIPTPAPFGYTLAEIKGSMDWDGFVVSDATLDSLPERWRIYRVDGKILLRYPIGTVVTFR